jgi:outer membrane protein TolC
VSYEQTSQDVIAEVKRSYYELLYLQHALELTQQSQVILEKIAMMGVADYGNEVTGLNDVMKAQSQTAQMTYDLVLLEELYIIETSRFNSLLNRDMNIKIELHDVLIKPLVALQNLSIEHNDSLQIAALNNEKTRINHQLARYTYLPDVNIGFKYVQIEDTGFGGQDAGRDGLSVMLNVSVPLWQSKNSATIRQARLQHAQSQAAQTDIQNTLQYQLKKSYFKLSNAERLIKLYGDTLLPQAQQAMDNAQMNYQTTQNGLAQFLETESTWLNFQLAYRRAKTDYLRYRVDLERLMGEDLTGGQHHAQ